MTITASLALVFVCVLLSGMTLISPSGDNCLRRWKQEGEDGEKALAALTWLGKLFLSSLQPSVSERKSSSCLLFRGISQLHWSRTLCNTETLQNNGNPSREDFFFHPLSYYPLLYCVVTQSSREPPEKHREKIKTQMKESSWGMRVQVLVEVACGVPAFKGQEFNSGVAQVFLHNCPPRRERQI